MSFEEAFEAPLRSPDTEGVDALEQHHGALPKSYRSFLEAIDGGVPEPQMLVFAHLTKPVTIGIRRIYSAVEAAERTAHHHSLGTLPPDTIAIATDLGGHHELFVVNDGGKRAGAIHVMTDESNETVAHTIDSFLPHAPKVADSIDQLLGECLLTTGEVDAAVAAILAAPPGKTAARSSTGSDQQPSEALDAAVYLHDVITDLYYTPLAVIRANDGAPAAPTWQPVEVHINQPDVSADWDVLAAGRFLVLRSAAVDELGELFEQYGELLEITTAEGPMWVFRCLNRVDALAEPSTALTDDGSFESPYELVFDRRKCADAGIFTLADHDGDSWHHTFYTRPVVEKIRNSTRARSFMPLKSR